MSDLPPKSLTFYPGHELSEKITNLASTHGVTVSDIIRRAIRAGLPIIEPHLAALSGASATPIAPVARLHRRKVAS